MHKDAVLLLGRILVATLFVPSGFSKLMNFSGTVSYISGAHMPMPQLMALGAVVVELGVGLAFLIGWRARWAAVILALFTVVAAVCFHNYWAAPDAMVQMQRINFYKNLAIAGGLLYAWVYGPGRWAVGRN
jgi:putative oxidoreductase